MEAAMENAEFRQVHDMADAAEIIPDDASLELCAVLFRNNLETAAAALSVIGTYRLTPHGRGLEYLLCIPCREASSLLRYAACHKLSGESSPYEDRSVSIMRDPDGVGSHAFYPQSHDFSLSAYEKMTESPLSQNDGCDISAPAMAAQEAASSMPVERSTRL